jgi:predicted N-acetyltransferase YhbS
VADGVVIRPERVADRPAIAEVVRAAFAEDGDGVAAFVERIRASERPRILNLTPMSVRPDRQRMGVGARLIRNALGRAEDAGEPAVMVEGIAAYYPRFGFERASALGFLAPHPKIPDDAFMVKRLRGYRPELAGRIVYPAAFDALGS